MAKNRNRQDKSKRPDLAAPHSPLKLEGVSKRGWKVIGVGIGIVVLGYFVLSMTDPQGQNWASILSPFLLLGGYATIGVGIVTRDPQTDSSDAPPK